MGQQNLPEKLTTDLIRSKVEDQFVSIVESTQNGLNFDKEISFAMQAVQNNPKLLGCDRATVYTAIYNVALTGVTLNPKLGYCHLVPRGKTCVLDISYRGLSKVLTDSLSVKNIEAHVVYRNDLFDMEMGTKSYLIHKPELVEERGEKIGSYSLATLNDGTKVFLFMRKDEIEKIKSKAMTKAIWNEWEDEMWKKTVIKRHFKTLPKTQRAEQAATVVDIDHKNSTVQFEQEKPQFGDILDSPDAAVVAE